MHKPMKPRREIDAESNLKSQLLDFQSRNPTDPFIERILKLLRNQPRCFDRDWFSDGHITGSSWILDLNRKSVLLTHHKKLDIWIQLGGHSDGDTDTLRVATREAQEESGLVVKPITLNLFDLDIHTIPARGQEPEHLHYDVRFAFEVIGTTEFTVSSESHALRWVPLDEVAEFTTEPSILRMVERTHQKFLLD